MLWRVSKATFSRHRASRSKSTSFWRCCKNVPSEQPVTGDARACYLSSGDGWRDAAKQLGGAFADDVTRLTQTQGE
ncbi:MAG: hypothetical protein H0W71_06710 [Sphingomonas sp.]|nr:hypothetical protein [Sphingomonas sp.]